MAKEAMKYLVDLASLASTIGAMQGIDDAADSDQYMSNLLESAHTKAAEEFDLEVIAAATASGSMNHMFEWGTAGINKGRTTRRMNPNNPEAKLWKHTFTGSGKNREADYIFEPSKVPVPLPTTAKTGISQQYLSKLKGKHIFWNKAAVMEAGTPVHISPKNKGGKLFIPHMDNPPPSARPIDIARGFTMYSGTVTVTPGAHSAGTFEAFWKRFWDGRGSKIMEEEINRSFREDMDRALAGTKGKSSMTPPSDIVFNEQVAAGRAKAKTTMRGRQ